MSRPDAGEVFLPREEYSLPPEDPISMRHRICRPAVFPLLGALSLCILLAGEELAQPAKGPGGFKAEKLEDCVVVKTPRGAEALRYQTKKPAGSKLSVESAAYFHPLTTPGGITLTDVAPDDHKHHRGVFLGWVEMHGRKHADFWGWGEKAPKEKRQILTTGVSDLTANGTGASFRVQNEWLADGEVMVHENLGVSFHAVEEAHVLDLTYTLEAASNVTLAQWAFSGFCVRGRKDGEVEAEGPRGLARYLDPKHEDPRSDWPSARWYAFTYKLQDGKTASVAVIDHPLNPPSLWHNHRELRMLNPCIVAPGRILLPAGKPLVLRYRVVAADGPASRQLLSALAEDWSAAK